MTSDIPHLRSRGRSRCSLLRRWRWLFCAVLVGIAHCHGVQTAHADVEQVQWGFDGQLVPNRFNLVSILFSNNTAQAFDGALELRKSVAGQYVDAPLVESVYLAPHSSRWVQFHVYSKLDWEEWRLSWGPSPSGDATLPKPRQGTPACVLLEDSDAISTGVGGAIKRFPENLFPVQLTATDGLKSVVLDHVPRWEEGRAKAFLDWVKAGGRVHLLRTAQGEYPQFTGVLGPLNGTAAHQNVGLGRVDRHDRSRRQLTGDYVEKVIAAGRDPAEVAAEAAAAVGEKKSPGGNNAAQTDTTFFTFQWEGDEVLLTALKKMSRPEHNWILIHFLSLAYIGLIFPGCFAIGKRREGDYRLVFGCLIGIVVLFSVAFLVVGRRGYGEQTSVHSVAIARVVGPDRYDVTQWSNAFVVDGGDYVFSHPGSARMYSSCQDQERVLGEIRNGAEARFTADMPPYSTRAFGHRVMAAAPTLEARLETFETRVELRNDTITLRDLSVQAAPARSERVLQNLVLAKGANFPADYRQAYVLFGRRVYSLRETDGRFELSSEAGSLLHFLQMQQQSGGERMRMIEPWSELEGTPEELYAALFLPLVARACNVSSDRAALDFHLPDDCVRLLVYAPMPPELFVDNERFGTQRGTVLYCLDIPFPER